MRETPAESGIAVEFSGTAREYFGIWIVNLLLSIVTLGIYSAWAKVRTRRYFLRNTTIAGRRFDYHARGLQILVGRIIVFAVFVVYGIVSTIYPYNLIFVGLLLIAIPWLFNRSLRFNAAMTSWSNVRFSFSGRYWAAFRVYILYPLLSALTAFLAMPFAFRARQRYVIGNHRLGGESFVFESGVGPFYRALLAAIAWLVGILVLTGLAFLFTVGPGGLGEMVYQFRVLPEPEPEAVLVLLGLIVGLLVAVLPLGTIFYAVARNAVYAATRTSGGHRFRSSVSASGLILIASTNTLAILLSVGLLIPWAQIRIARYMAAHTQLVPSGSLDTLVGSVEERPTAVGEAYADMEGFDVGAAI